MNNSELTPKQEELKRRLEQIRRQRNAEAANKNTQKQAPKSTKTQSKRNDKADRKTSQQKRQQDKPMNAPLVQSKTEAKLKEDELYKKQDMAKKIEHKKKNSLVKQLTDSNRLKDAIILSEVLSKPIALRKK